MTRRRPLVVAAFVVAGLTVATATAPTASAEPVAPTAAVTTGSISGVVTGPGGFRAPGVTVSAYTDVTAAPVRTTTTKSTGAYALNALPGDQVFQVCFDPSTAPGNPPTGWIASCHRAPDPAGFFVAAGAAVTGVDDVLAVGGAVTGRVAADSSTPLGGVVVTATGYGLLVDPATSQRASAAARTAGVLRPTAGTTGIVHLRTTTAADGTYTVKGLPASGDWQICADGAAATGGSTNGYRLTCQGGVDVAAGATSTADVTAAPGGVLAGRVTGPGGSGVAGATVTVAQPAGGATVASVTTDANGDYRRAGLAGTYTVCAQPAVDQPAPGLLRQCAGGPAGGSAALAGPVTVTAGSTTTTDLTLAAGGDAKLTVTNAPGAPLAGVTVRLTDGPTPARGASGADGVVTLTSLAPGVYTACTGEEADPAQKRLASCFRLLTIRAGQETTASLVSQPASTLTGVVRDAAGSPVAGAEIRVQRSVPSPQVGVTVRVRTRADGGWTVSGRPPGTYGVAAVPLHTADAAGPSGASETVVVGTATATTAATLTLPVGSGIQGHVTRGATPVPGAVVTVGALATVTDATGRYAISELATSASVVVCASRVPTTPAGATPTCGLAPGTTAGTVRTFDLDLRPTGAGLTGTVTDSAGTPVPDVSVSIKLKGTSSYAEYARTDAAGRYALTLLQPGGTSLCFTPTSLVKKCLSVTLPAGSTTTHDVVLADGVISGTVTTGGQPLGGALAKLYERRGYDLGVAVPTAADGTYAFHGLAGKSYRICVSPSPDLLVRFPTGLRTRCTGGAATPGNASQVPVGSTQDIDLPLGAALTGRVVTPSGQPLSGATVEVTPAPVATTTDGGGFRALSLPGGTQQVCADDTVSSSTFAGYLRTCTATPLTPGTTTSADLPVRLAGGVTGRVTGPDGSPLAGVYVGVHADANIFAGGTTGADGTYTVPRLTANTYSVCTTAPAGYVSECWDDQPQNGTPTPVTVTTGYTTGIDLQLAGAAVLTVTVTDSAGNRLGAVGLDVVADPSGRQLAGGTNPSDGSSETFSNLPVGPARVCTDTPDSGPGYGGSSTTGYLDTCVDVDLALGPNALTIVAPSGNALSGTIRDTNGNPVRNPEVYATNRTTGVTSGLYGYTTVPGAYRGAALPPGEYVVCSSGPFRTTNPPYGYVTSCSDPVSLTGHGQSATVDLVLRAGGGLTGRFVDTAGAGVPNVPLGPGVDTAGTAFSDSTGAFTLGGFDTGPSEICWATQQMAGGPATGWASGCATFTTTAGALTTAPPITLGAGAQVGGTVTNPAHVYVVITGPGGWTQSVTLGPTGQWSVKGLPTGTLTVQARSTTSSATVSRTVTVAAGDVRPNVNMTFPGG